MDKRLFFLINMAQHRLFKFADTRCEEQLGISVTQAAAMMFINKQPGCLQKELSRALGLNNPAVTGLVGRMIKNELLIKKPCDIDGRASRLHLSAKGEEIVPNIFPLTDQINIMLTEEFSDSDIEVVLRFLNHVMDKFKEPKR